jgi:hypothetical protein
MKTLEYAFALVLGNTGAVVADVNLDDVSDAFAAQGDLSAGGRVFECVVDQVGDQFPEQRRIAGHRRKIALHAEVDLLLVGDAQPVVEHLVDQLGQIDRRRIRHQMLTALGSGQRQQLIGQASDALDRLAQILRHRLVSLLAAEQFDLDLQTGEGRAQLMRSILQKFPLRGVRILQARQEGVQRTHQRVDFDGHLVQIDRGEILAGTVGKLRLQVIQRCQAGGDSVAYDGSDGGEYQKNGQTEAEQQVANGRTALAQCFGDRDVDALPVDDRVETHPAYGV